MYILGDVGLRVSLAYQKVLKLHLLLNMSKLFMVDQFKALKLVHSFHLQSQKKENYMVGEKQRWDNQVKENKEKSDYQQEYLLQICLQNRNKELLDVQQVMDIQHVLQKMVIFILGVLISMDNQGWEINRQDGTQKVLQLMLKEINQVLKSK